MVKKKIVIGTVPQDITFKITVAHDITFKLTNCTRKLKTILLVPKFSLT